MRTLAVLISAASVLPIWPAIASEIPVAERKSGYEFMSGETRAMQDDDAANPGMLWVLDGKAFWNRTDGEANKSCADCHNEASSSMKGAAARYPAFDKRIGRPIDLEQRINLCRTEQQKATPLAFESREMVALAAFIGQQSRGMPISVRDDEQTKSFIEAGRTIFERRQGQLNLSCAQCHDDNWRGKLAGAPITQGHATGYPLYRLDGGNGFAAAPAAQLPCRQSGALHLRRARICQCRALSDVACSRYAGRNPGGTPLMD